MTVIIGRLMVSLWEVHHHQKIKGDAILYARYMDDIIRNINKENIEAKLIEINNYHPSLKFTIEQENNHSLPFLNIKISRLGTSLTSIWYNKPTDTGLTMNYHATAPRRYKKSVISGLVHRIHRACSSWENFHVSLEKAKKVLEANQYPPHFYNPIIKSTLDQIMKPESETEATNEPEEEKVKEKLVFIQYRGKISEKFQESLLRIKAPSKVIFTIRKLKIVYHL